MRRSSKLVMNGSSKMMSLPQYGQTLGADGLRVGLEDNILYGKNPDGSKDIATNVRLVERAVALAKLAGREIATAEEARELLGIKRNCLRDEKTYPVTYTE